MALIKYCIYSKYVRVYKKKCFQFTCKYINYDCDESFVSKWKHELCNTNSFIIIFQGSQHQLRIKKDLCIHYHGHICISKAFYFILFWKEFNWTNIFINCFVISFNKISIFPLNETSINNMTLQSLVWKRKRRVINWRSYTKFGLKRLCNMKARKREIATTN